MLFQDFKLFDILRDPIQFISTALDVPSWSCNGLNI